MNLPYLYNYVCNTKNNTVFENDIQLNLQHFN